MAKISVIVSCYNEEKALPLFYEEMEKNIREFENTEFEYIFITAGKKNKIKSMANSGYTISEIAKSVGLSTSMVSKELKG